eukprot:TRINITY_DN136_c0_g1_i1.p1 TRINITY_DN136_c0_g1~~TRINITY_DN136_c0_g1_i1.p1  ORF type:complete len:138 (+),score=5.86 TRINITY_DN136_c0_g1_i1:337-750(+)
MDESYGSLLNEQQRKKVHEIALAVAQDGFTISCNDDFALLGYKHKDRARDRVRELGRVGIDYIVVPRPNQVPWEDYLLTRQFVEDILVRSRSELGKVILSFYREVRDSYFRGTEVGRQSQEMLVAAHANNEAIRVGN